MAGDDEIVQGYPPNADGMQADSITIDDITKAYQLTDMVIPDGMCLMIKAWPNPPNVGIIFVAESRAYILDAQHKHVVPLSADTFVKYQVKNASCFWIGGSAVGDMVTFTAEKNKKA